VEWLAAYLVGLIIPALTRQTTDDCRGWSQLKPGVRACGETVRPYVVEQRGWINRTCSGWKPSTYSMPQGTIFITQASYRPQRPLNGAHHRPANCGLLGQSFVGVRYGARLISTLSDQRYIGTNKFYVDNGRLTQRSLSVYRMPT
jgi:hypothetical protein